MDGVNKEVNTTTSTASIPLDGAKQVKYDDARACATSEMAVDQSGISGERSNEVQLGQCSGGC